MEELNAIMAAPRIPEIIYRYSRYQFEATIEFLKQCDMKYGLQIMETQEMQDAVERLRFELPKEDTGSFSFDKRNKDTKENTGGISIDDLFNRFDELQEKGLGDKTEEGQELRALIRSFIEQEKLPVRVTRSTTNADLLDMLEEAVQNGTSEETEEKDNEPETPASTEETTTRNRRR